MKTPTPWLCGLAMVVVLNFIESFFISPAVRMFRVPLMLAAYVIGVVLFFKLGVWPALALWWGIGLVIGLLRWNDECRRARHRKDVDPEPLSLMRVVRGLFAWPIMVPLVLSAAVAAFVVNALWNLCYTLYRLLLPNHVPHYKGLDGCKDAAISGDARAQFTLGNAYQRGEYGLPQDYAEAAKWFRKAAEQNHHNAQLFLGLYLAEGKGVEKNVVEGLMWIVLSEVVCVSHGGGYLFRDAAHQASARTKAQMTEEQIAQTWVMLDSSPLYRKPRIRFRAL